MLTREDLRDSRFFIVFLGVLASLGPIAIDAYLPMMPHVAEYFKTDIVSVNLTISAFLIGMGAGQFFGGALSDQLGRKRVGLIGLAIFSVVSLCILFVPTILAVQGLRFVQGIGGGFTSVICLAQVRDLYPANEVMRRFSNVVMVVLLTPMLAPLLGALLVPLGWQSVFVMLCMLAVFSWFVYSLVIPETLLERPERSSLVGMLAGYAHVVRLRVNGQLTAIRFILFSGFSAGIFMTFVTNSAFIYMQHFGVSPYWFALIFGLHGLAMMIGNRMAVKLSFYWSAYKVLSVVNLVQIVITAGLSLLIFSDLDHLSFVLAMTFCSMVVNGALMPTAAARFITYFSKNVGAAVSLNTTAVFLGGGTIGAVASLLSNGKLLPVFMVMMVCAVIARLLLLSIKDR